MSNSHPNKFEYHNPEKDVKIIINPSRDSNLSENGKYSLQQRYLLENETYQEIFARNATTYCEDQPHAQRIYNYISKGWFMPATPVLSNAGTKRGLPVSCFLNSVGDSLRDIGNIYRENQSLASNGGGIGTYWGDVRSINEKIKTGLTSGIIPFIHIMDAYTLAISQGSLRRGSAAVYLPVWHPEIEEFIELRKPSGDFNRRSFNLHNGVALTDEFMECVKHNKDYALVSPKTGETIKYINARILYQKILETRMQTGEPYIIHIDTINRARPQHHKDLNLEVKQSNLCAEITLPTGKDHLGKERTAVCCLSSLNLEKWDEWEPVAEEFIEDVLLFLDNVIQDYIDNAPEEQKHAAYSAMRERSVGMGVMGFHSYLQNHMIPIESALAKSQNFRFFKTIKKYADLASRRIAERKGPCPDAEECGVMERFSYKIAIAPTASISVIAGNTSPGIDPIRANHFTHKTLGGSKSFKNKKLEELLEQKGQNTEETWNHIIQNKGSVQKLEFLTEKEKLIFKTATEIDHRWIVELAADRAPYICQSQSLNFFLPADIKKWDLLMLHYMAWEKGLKSLYYCRSESVQRAGYVGDVSSDNTITKNEITVDGLKKYDECLACQ